MWNESEHPRDDDGKFVEKSGYDLLTEKKRALKDSAYTRMPRKGDYVRVSALMGSDEGLEYLGYDDFQREERKEYYQERIEKRKAAWIAARQKEEEWERERAAAYRAKAEEEQKWKKGRLSNVMANTNANEVAAQRLIDVVDRADDAYEKAMSNQKYGYASGGYVGNSRSVRATNAETDGKFPAGRAANILGITSMKLKKYLRPTEWHHTGALYNATDYYDISDLCDIAADLQAEDSAADIRKDYSAESIEKFEAIYGVKIK